METTEDEIRDIAERYRVPVEVVKAILIDFWNFMGIAITFTNAPQLRVLPAKDGYACKICGIIEDAKPDGALPEGWVEKKYAEGSGFICPAPYCQRECV